MPKDLPPDLGKILSFPRKPKGKSGRGGGGSGTAEIELALSLLSGSIFGALGSPRSDQSDRTGDSRSLLRSARSRKLNQNSRGMTNRLEKLS